MAHSSWDILYTSYTITQNNTQTRHKIHRTMKDKIQQWKACANNEDALLPMMECENISTTFTIIMSVFTMSFPSFHFSTLKYHQSCYRSLPYTSLHLSSLHFTSPNYNLRFNYNRFISQKVRKPAKSHSSSIMHAMLRVLTNALEVLRIREQRQFIVIGMTVRVGEE
jgi:hypothetical protein